MRPMASAQADESSTARTRTIAEVADEFGVTHRAVRHYEELGLLSPGSFTAAIGSAWR